MFALRQRLAGLPMVGAFLALAAGVSFTHYFVVPVWFGLCGFLLLGGCSFLYDTRARGMLVWAALVCLGACLPASDGFSEGTAAHEWAVARFSELPLSKESRSVVEAIVVGQRSGISDSLREAYSVSGASHLLAVSGLHVGLVFALAFALCSGLVFVRGGHLWRSLIVLGVVWAYALLTGLSPSVIRAAIMFSVLQLSVAFSGTYVSLNALGVAGVVMLLVDASYLFSLSFQLSALAVAGIICWGVPLSRALRTRFAAVNWVVGTLVMGLTATLATAPLIAFRFARVSIVGLALNPFVIFLTTIIVFFGVLWLVFPIVPAAFSWVLSSAASAQNRIVVKAAGWQSAAVTWEPSLATVLGAYAVFTALTLLFWSGAWNFSYLRSRNERL